MSTFLELLFAGIALGAVYALVALGFTVVFRASRVINFAQGELLALGAFVVSWLVIDIHVPFWLAFVVGAAGTGLAAFIFQQGVLRFALGRPDFTIVMLTLGLATVLQAVLPTLFGSTGRANGDPWGGTSVRAGDVALAWVQVWTIVAALLVLAAFWVFNNHSKYGLAMRSAASDPEAALAVGVPLRRVYATAWVLAGVVACIGGVFLGGYPNTVDPNIGNTALLAFPAIILGGIDSTTGAVVGGFLIGIVEELTAGYQPQYASWLGSNFYLVAPYVLMIIVLLIRPYGLFGSRPAERL
ncbi:MAG: branched-chain amino acid ABC transporter permease [Candidatus Dormibacteraeota bacterium]|nr:branched-chain amino acid ABC transporter permease [Candidatus Dormibacteraeota bacterium]